MTTGKQLVKGARVRTHDNAIGTVVHVDDHGWIDVREDGNGKVYSFLPSQLTRIAGVA